jgi:HlyD family secretion protein
MIRLAAVSLVALLAAAPSVVPAALAAEAATKTAGPAVTVQSIKREMITDSVIVTGTLVAREDILISAQIDGYAITDILVEEGDRVKAGQVLAKLNPQTLEASLAQNTAQIARSDAAIASAQSSIVEAQALVAQAQNSFQRSQTLQREGITSAEVFDQRKASALQAQARLVSAREQLRLSEADKALALAQRSDWMIRIERTAIKAPVDGIISRRTARVGSIASSLADPLFRLIKDGMIELEADVAETTLNRLSVGMRADVTPAGRDKPVSATVRLISPEITKASRLGRVRLQLDPAPGLTIGAFARADITLARKDTVVAPLSAVLFAPEGARVQVVKDGVVETRAITTGIRGMGRIEALSGLQAGETVVSISGTFLRNGDRVTPVKAE